MQNLWDGIIVTLKRFNYITGSTTTLLTFDSNSFSSSSLYQTQMVYYCDGVWWPFDFDNNAYFLEATLIKTASAGSPVLASISLHSVYEECLN
jgi:hypothetical protein